MFLHHKNIFAAMMLLNCLHVLVPGLHKIARADPPCNVSYIYSRRDLSRYKHNQYPSELMLSVIWITRQKNCGDPSRHIKIVTCRALIKVVHFLPCHCTDRAFVCQLQVSQLLLFVSVLPCSLSWKMCQKRKLARVSHTASLSRSIFIPCFFFLTEINRLQLDFFNYISLS